MYILLLQSVSFLLRTCEPCLSLLSTCLFSNVIPGIGTHKRKDLDGLLLSSLQRVKKFIKSLLCLAKGGLS